MEIVVKKKSPDLPEIKQKSSVFYYCGSRSFKIAQYVSVIFTVLIMWESFVTANSTFVITFIACFLSV